MADKGSCDTGTIMALNFGIRSDVNRHLKNMKLLMT
jgi:hypothetical protein